MKYYIYQNENDKRNLTLKQDIISHLKTVVTDPTQADLIIVLWWDGTMLEAVQALHHYNKTFFGVNCGTLWFLLNDIKSVTEIPTSIEWLQLITEPFLQATIETTAWEIHDTILAVNDIVINPHLHYYPQFIIEKNWQPIKTLQGSWLIITSAIWSTWYRANFDGPLIPTWQDNIWLMWNGTGGFKYSLMKWPYPYTINIVARTPIDAYIDGTFSIFKDISSITYTPSQKTFTLAFSHKDFHEKRLQLHSSKLERFL